MKKHIKIVEKEEEESSEDEHMMGDEQPFTTGNEGEEEEEDDNEDEEPSDEDEEPGILGADDGDDDEDDDMDEEDDMEEDDDEVEDEEDEFDDEEEDEKPRGPLGPAAKFLEGEKGASFAKAFSKILDHKVKLRPVEGDEDPTLILAESRSVAKRKAEEEEAAKASRASKKMRLDMKNRGHKRVLQKGLDTGADLKEKQLSRIATRGVVMLFNAIAKAQKKGEGSSDHAGGSKAAKLSKASFLAQLKGPTAAAGSSALQGGGVLGLGKEKAHGQKKEIEAKVGAGWMSKEFTGLPSKSNMKNWDKKGAEDDEERVEMNSEEDDDDGW